MAEKNKSIHIGDYLYAFLSLYYCRNTKNIEVLFHENLYPFYSVTNIISLDLWETIVFSAIFAVVCRAYNPFRLVCGT